MPRSSKQNLVYVTDNINFLIMADMNSSTPKKKRKKKDITKIYRLDSSFIILCNNLIEK